jgi:hypothetical protein
MAIQHEPNLKFPLLSAFELEGNVEDGLTDSHRTVLRTTPVPPLVSPEPVTEPRALAAWAPAQEAMHPVVRRAERWLGFLGRFIDSRLANEELGEALERMNRVARAGAPAWVLYSMTGVSAFWTLTHAVRERLGKWRR